MHREVKLLSPAGHWDALRAAVANGADAVFFGVEKFNARARAQNFHTEELPDIMSFLHGYGVKGYVTFNILVFENELEEAKRLVNACIDAGVDALIVQDLGLVKMIREISPDFPIHGSTQMTITSPEAVEFTKPFQLEVVVLGRENNLKQIRTIGEQAKLPMEIFVHGALCVSYSGQCLTSEMWGGRSANRGECAQACRLPYDLMVDGVHRPMGDVTYLLSPQDLAAIELIPELIEAGVTTFKIEGRLKSAEYVANVTSKYRKAIDAYFSGLNPQPTVSDMRELQQSFSRGFTYGFLKGTNNKQLVEGTFPKSRGVYLGRVKEVTREGVLCELEAPLKRGDGIVFDAGDPTQQEEGGRVYDLKQRGSKVEGELPGGLAEIVMGRNDVELYRIHPGDRIWRTSDPVLDRKLRATFETDKPYRTFPLSVSVFGKVGQPLITTWTDESTRYSVTIHSTLSLVVAEKHPLNLTTLREQFGRLGGTLFWLDGLSAELTGEAMVPISELNRIRRQAVEQLEHARRRPPVYVRREIDPYADAEAPAIRAQQPRLTALCRTLEQVQAVAERTDIEFIYADFEFIKHFPGAIERVRACGKKIALATPRIHMPGENGYFANMLRLQPDAILVRNTGAVYWFTRARQQQQSGESVPELIGDFSLNVANHKAVQLFIAAGLASVTPSYDLNIQQMIDLLQQTDTSQLEIVIHQHLPMFHTEHCVYCTFLSEGTDYTNCGRPCEEHRVSLRDRVGFSHPVRVDEGCRNTVYNAIEQSGAEYLQTFLDLGVPSYRVEFLEESAQQVVKVIDLYSRALCGEMSGNQVWRTLKATNQLGVTRGQLVK